MNAKLSAKTVTAAAQGCEEVTVTEELEDGSPGDTFTSSESFAVCRDCDVLISSETMDQRLGEEKLLFIRTGYVIKKLSQSNPIPANRNVLALAITVNVQVGGSSEITLSGFQGALVPGCGLEDCYNELLNLIDIECAVEVSFEPEKV